MDDILSAKFIIEVNLDLILPKRRNLAIKINKILKK